MVFLYEFGWCGLMIVLIFCLEFVFGFVRDFKLIVGGDFLIGCWFFEIMLLFFFWDINVWIVCVNFGRIIWDIDVVIFLMLILLFVGFVWFGMFWSFDFLVLFGRWVFLVNFFFLVCWIFFEWEVWWGCILNNFFLFSLFSWFVYNCCRMWCNEKKVWCYNVYGEWNFLDLFIV